MSIMPVYSDKFGGSILVDTETGKWVWGSQPSGRTEFYIEEGTCREVIRVRDFEYGSDYWESVQGAFDEFVHENESLDINSDLELGI